MKEAFGEKSGALAIWLEWIESVVWLPLVLSFIASCIAFIIDPTLADNRYFMLTVMLSVLWSGTLLNFLSMQTSGWVSTLGIISGSIIPGIAIIGLGAYWFGTHPVTEIQFNMPSFFPEFSFSSLSYFAGVALGFGGIEVAAFYIQNTKNPQRNFPRATFISAGGVIAIYILGALSIAVVIPKEDINLSAGMMQAMREFFRFLHIPWATPLFALFSVVGGFALLNTWLIGPSKGLLASAQNGDLPPFTRFTNRHGSPVAILLMQALIGSALVSMNLLIPTINHFYWIFQTQAAQLILLMYLMIFASVIKLRYSQPNTTRPYQIPGGKFGVWLIAGSGTLFCLVAFSLGFVPPEEYQFTNPASYALILGGGIVIFCSPPFLWQAWKRITAR